MFLNFLANLTLKHFFLNIRKVILVNICVERVSAEVIGLLNTGPMQYLVHPLADLSYLARYIRKSTLSIAYGGSGQSIKPPLSLLETLTFKLIL